MKGTAPHRSGVRRAESETSALADRGPDVCPILVSIALACAACTPAQQRYASYATEATALGALACDGGSTHEFLTESPYIETNPILGKHPSSADVWLYLGTIGALVVLSTHAIPLPAWARIGVNSTVTAIEVSSNIHNIGYGTSACGLGHWQMP